MEVDKEGEHMKKMLCVLFFMMLLIPVVTADNKDTLVPFKQDSTILLDYESLDGNSTAVVDIEFSGSVHEYQGNWYGLFFVLISVSQGYRRVSFCDVTLIVGDFNVTQNAIFARPTVDGTHSERGVSVTFSSSFIVPQSMVILDAVNGTLNFQAGYQFGIDGYALVTEDTMTGVAIVKIDGVQYELPDEEPKIVDTPFEEPEEEPDEEESPVDNGEGEVDMRYFWGRAAVAGVGKGVRAGVGIEGYGTEAISTPPEHRLHHGRRCGVRGFGLLQSRLAHPDAQHRPAGEGGDALYRRAFPLGGLHADALWGAERALLLALAARTGRALCLRAATD